jgi:hypothetical protein
LIDKQMIYNLIENEVECEFLDFKAKHYPKKGTADLLKDVMAMANSSHKGNKYIILGVKDNPVEGRFIVGVQENEVVDSATYQQYVTNNIEPDLSVDVYYVNYNEKTIGVLEITNTTNKPYIIKKNIPGLNEGCCLVRKGSYNSVAKRADYDLFYKKDEKFELGILDPTLRAVDDKNGIAYLDVSFRNLTTNPITLMGGGLFLEYNGHEITKHRIFGLNSLVGANFRLEVPPKSEMTGDLYFGFTSNDCLRLGLDKYGVSDKLFNFKLIVFDSMDNKYECHSEDGVVFAKGDFLWKVQNQSTLY